MALRSRTGLLESVRKPLKKLKQVESVEFPTFTRPAPFVLKPFAGVYNPFPYGCSILCNHPADLEAKDVVKRAKDSWATDGKALLLPEELLAIRTSLLQNALPYADGEVAVPEELFRRYTETDSRPLTPAPTLASGGTRGSGRRCVTPDPTHPPRARTLLVLDLRRSHSQDTLSCLGQALPPTRTPTPSVRSAKRRKPTPKKTPQPKTEGPSKNQKSTAECPKPLLVVPGDTGGSEDEEIPRRRGKKMKSKKSDKDTEKEFPVMEDPGETQISTIGEDSAGASARPSISVFPVEEVVTTPDPKVDGSEPSRLQLQSFIDVPLLRQLHRELDQESIDAEFAPRRKRAMEEAFKCCPQKKRDGKEMRLLKRELKSSDVYADEWLSMPRTFTRRSSRFELPLDSRTLNTMTPLQYLQRHVFVSSGRILLYNLVYNRHIEEQEDEETDRNFSGKKVLEALGEVMGRPLSQTEAQEFQGLVGWLDTEFLDFRLWTGLCALCERLLALQFISKTPSRLEDPCHEVEQADFGTLPRKLLALKPDPRLKTILMAIYEL